MRTLLAATLLTCLLAGCANQELPVPVVPNRAIAPDLYEPHVESEHRLAVGDKIQVRSYFDAALNQEIVVRPDGRVSLLFIGDTQVAGMSPDQLDELITTQYSEVLQDPEITVVVTEPSNMAVYVGGEVQRPTIVPLSGQMTAVQALTVAGGFLPSADRQQVLLLRQTPDAVMEVSKLNVAEVLQSGAPDIYLRRHDVLYVPKTGIAIAGDFVDQYINRIIPNTVRFQFNLVKDLK